MRNFVVGRNRQLPIATIVSPVDVNGTRRQDASERGKTRSHVTYFNSCSISLRTRGWLQLRSAPGASYGPQRSGEKSGATTSRPDAHQGRHRDRQHRKDAGGVGELAVRPTAVTFSVTDDLRGGVTPPGVDSPGTVPRPLARRVNRITTPDTAAANPNRHRPTNA